jgi:hypothetical protein
VLRQCAGAFGDHGAHWRSYRSEYSPSRVYHLESFKAQRGIRISLASASGPAHEGPPDASPSLLSSSKRVTMVTGQPSVKISHDSSAVGSTRQNLSVSPKLASRCQNAPAASKVGSQRLTMPAPPENPGQRQNGAASPKRSSGVLPPQGQGLNMRPSSMRRQGTPCRPTATDTLMPPTPAVCAVGQGGFGAKETVDVILLDRAGQESCQHRVRAQETSLHIISIAMAEW